jgi:hypothetical protein
MTQPLNYTPKAIEALLGHPATGMPGTAAGLRYIAGKLREAQVFVLADHGELLDRSKPRPEVPGVLFRPPFPVVALEYTAATKEWGQGFYDEAKCSKRIALAWNWSNDLPPELRQWARLDLSDGVVVASIAYYDAQATWFPVGAAMHIPYEAAWEEAPGSPFRKSLLEAGRMNAALASAKSLPGVPIGLLPEGIVGAVQQHGSIDFVMDAISADLMDEVSAYTDLCYALACKNVTTRHAPPPAALNRQRIRAGKLPLMGFHVLELAGGGVMPGVARDGDRTAPRAHLRRGHIRRLGADRVTWVNSTVVQGRGFVDKVYAA